MRGIGTNRETAGELTTRSHTGELFGRRSLYVGSNEFLPSIKEASCSRRIGPDPANSPDFQAEPKSEMRITPKPGGTDRLLKVTVPDPGYRVRTKSASERAIKCLVGFGRGEK